MRALYAFSSRGGCAAAHGLHRAAGHEQAGRLQLADEYRQLWEILVSAMEQFAWVRSEMPLTLDRFAQLFRLVLGELFDVGSDSGVARPRELRQHRACVCGENVEICHPAAASTTALIPKDPVLDLAA